MTILVVDDNSVTRSAVVKPLEMDAYVGIGEVSAESAIVLLSSLSPDAILLEMMLAGNERRFIHQASAKRLAIQLYSPDRV